jgi:TetR/AcrR family transcriptional repressor of mexJK operon
LVKALENYHKRTRQITNAAKKLFFAKGYNTTSMDDIAKTARLTKQTIYRYFPSKSELFQSILESSTNTDAAPANYFFGEGNPRTELVQFSIAYLKHHTSPEHIATIRLLMFEESKMEDFGKTFMDSGPKKGVAILSSFLEKRFPQLQEPEVKAKLLIAMLSAIWFPLLLRVVSRPTEKELKDHARIVVDFFLKGCSPPELLDTEINSNASKHELVSEV